MGGLIVTKVSFWNHCIILARQNMISDEIRRAVECVDGGDEV